MARYINLDKVEFLKVKGNKEFNHGVDCCIDELLKIEPVDVIEIPKNATNGNMIQNTFPNIPIKIFEDMNTVIFGNAQFDLDWWNAPYRKESNGKI